MRLNVAVVVLLTGLVAATYGFGIYLFAQLVPDMQASLGFGFSYVGTITASAQLGFLLCAMLAVWSLSPVVLMIWSSKVSSGNAARHWAATMLACASASALPRVPMVMVVSDIAGVKR